MRRYDERHKLLRERKRLRGLLELASRWRQVEEARLFLDALAARVTGQLPEIVGDQILDEWIAWARERLIGYDPLEAGLAAVFRTVAAIDQWTYRRDQA